MAGSAFALEYAFPPASRVIIPKQRESKGGHYENQTHSSATLYLYLYGFPGMGCLIPSNCR
jgi:hypothetical protein